MGVNIIEDVEKSLSKLKIDQPPTTKVKVGLQEKVNNQ